MIIVLPVAVTQVIDHIAALLWATYIKIYVFEVLTIVLTFYSLLCLKFLYYMYFIFCRNDNLYFLFLLRARRGQNNFTRMAGNHRVIVDFPRARK